MQDSVRIILAMCRVHSCHSPIQNTGTPIYLSPELIPIPIGKKLSFSRGTDVFAFGIVLWELWARSRPYENFKSKFQVWNAVMEGYRLPMTPILDDDMGREEKISSPIKSKRKGKRGVDVKEIQVKVSCRSWPKSIAKIIEKCCDEDPSYRPSFSQINRKWQKLVNSATDPLEDMIVEAGPWFPADVKSAEIFQFEGLIVTDKNKNEDQRDRDRRANTWSNKKWTDLVFELLRSNHIRVSRKTKTMEFSKLKTVSLQRCRISEQLLHSLHPKSVFTLDLEILGPKSNSFDRTFQFERSITLSFNILGTKTIQVHPCASFYEAAQRIDCTDFSNVFCTDKRNV